VGGDPDEIRTRLAERFQLRARAFEVRGVEQLPLTASGKVDYAALDGSS
jgi:acyl-CoA synthetase (AMP-forming)/AMP-acid ligase II